MARLLLISLVLLTGCGQMYWTRYDSTSTFDRFAADHRECLSAAGFPVADRPGYVVVPESGFRACMVARGWSREQWTEYDKPTGRFRGIEDFPSRPITLDAIPEQPEAGPGATDAGQQPTGPRACAHLSSGCRPAR